MRICCACSVHVYIITTFHRERWEIAGSIWADGGANEMMIDQRNNETREKKTPTETAINVMNCCMFIAWSQSNVSVVLYRNVLVCTVYGVYERCTMYVCEDHAYRRQFKRILIASYDVVRCSIRRN